MKATLSDGEKGVADKIGDDDKEAIEKALEEANEWLDDNQEAEKEDFDEKLKEVQDACSPIISKVYRESGGAPGRRLRRRRRPRRPRRALGSRRQREGAGDGECGGCSENLDRSNQPGKSRPHARPSRRTSSCSFCGGSHSKHAPPSSS